jgi:hypothetical protein
MGQVKVTYYKIYETILRLLESGVKLHDLDDRAEKKLSKDEFEFYLHYKKDILLEIAGTMESSVNEKFTEGGDPIEDMSIGIYGKKDFETESDAADWMIKIIPILLKLKKIPYNIIESNYMYINEKYIEKIRKYENEYIFINGISVRNINSRQKNINYTIKEKLVLKGYSEWPGETKKENIHEAFHEGGDPIEDMGIGIGHWLDKVKEIFAEAYFASEEDAEIYIKIAHDKLEELYKIGLSEEKAADICYNDNPDFLTELEEITQGDLENFGEPLDDLKANCRDFQNLGDKEYADDLTTYLMGRHRDYDYEELRDIADNWVGYDPSKEIDESYIMKSLDEGCGCGGIRRPKPGIRPGLIRRPTPRPVSRPVFRPRPGPGAPKIHEKFTPEGDPIRDLGIGLTLNQKAEKFFDTARGNVDIISEIYFGDKKHFGYAYILHRFFSNTLYRNYDVQKAFVEACENENYYGNRPDVVEDRRIIADVLKIHFNIDVDYIFENQNNKYKNDKYIMKKLNEETGRYDIDKIVKTALNSADKWIDQQDFKYFSNEVTRMAKERVPIEELLEFYREFIDTHIDNFFSKLTIVDRDFLNDHRDEIVEKIVKEAVPILPEMQEEDDFEKIIRQSKKKEAVPKTYAQMSQFDLKKEIDKALDAKDYDTLRKIHPYLKEGFLKHHVDDVLNEEFLMNPLR